MLRGPGWGRGGNGGEEKLVVSGEQEFLFLPLAGELLVGTHSPGGGSTSVSTPAQLGPRPGPAPDACSPSHVAVPAARRL